MKIIRIPANAIDGHNFPSTTYFQIFNRRFVWHEGKYDGWYKFK